MRSRIPMRVTAVLALLTGAAALAATPGHAGSDPEITVMTRNLYFGTNLDRVVRAQTLAAFVAAVATSYTNALATDFAGRAEAWASEIAEHEPDLVGLQEAALWRTGPTDFSPAPNATTVTADFVQLLLAELDRLGERYDVVAMATGYDVEAPGAFAAGLMDVRLTQREVILARRGAGLRVDNPQGGQYAARLTIPTVGGPVSLPWAWASVDVTVAGEVFRFATTHLDPAADPLRLAQAAEFLSGPGATWLPLVWLGDFNATPGSSPYAAITAAGLEDAWAGKYPGAPGFTWGHAEDLRNPLPTLDRRIDHVFTRGPFEVEEAELVGDELGDRLASGMWPSDHAGVVVTLELEEEEKEE